jgi:hypothetical protein
MGAPPAPSAENFGARAQGGLGTHKAGRTAGAGAQPGMGGPGAGSDENFGARAGGGTGTHQAGRTAGAGPQRTRTVKHPL